MSAAVIEAPAIQPDTGDPAPRLSDDPIYCTPLYAGHPVRPRRAAQPSGRIVWSWGPERRAQAITGVFIEWGDRNWKMGLAVSPYLVDAGQPLHIIAALHQLL